ncbi:hypothetical protein [Oceanobacillus sp. CAU 1775]
MKNKWLLRFGASVLAITLLTGCGTNNDPADEPLNEEFDNGGDMMDGGDGNGNGGNTNGGN